MGWRILIENALGLRKSIKISLGPPRGHPGALQCTPIHPDTPWCTPAGADGHGVRVSLGNFGGVPFFPVWYFFKKFNGGESATFYLSMSAECMQKTGLTFPGGSPCWMMPHYAGGPNPSKCRLFWTCDLGGVGPHRTPCSHLVLVNSFSQKILPEGSFSSLCVCVCQYLSYDHIRWSSFHFLFILFYMYSFSGIRPPCGDGPPRLWVRKKNKNEKIKK